MFMFCGTLLADFSRGPNSAIGGLVMSGGRYSCAPSLTLNYLPPLQQIDLDNESELVLWGGG